MSLTKKLISSLTLHTQLLLEHANPLKSQVFYELAENKNSLIHSLSDIDVLLEYFFEQTDEEFDQSIKVLNTLNRNYKRLVDKQLSFSLNCENKYIIRSSGIHYCPRTIYYVHKKESLVKTLKNGSQTTTYIYKVLNLKTLKSKTITQKTVKKYYKEALPSDFEELELAPINLETALNLYA